jgi:MFS family permease
LPDAAAERHAADDEPVDRSYRELLRVPNLGRVLVSMQVARIAQSMVGVALVLFTLERFGSAPFAGLVTFASVFPGLLIAPIAGALLDRHGRIRLVLLDYVVALGAMALIAGLAILDVLPGWLLVIIAIVSSLTSILSHVGLRSLFPIMVPEPLWERVNAVDSNGYVVATIVGPPIAAALVGLFGGPVALLVIGVAFGIAAAVLVGVPDPAGTLETTGRVLADAWAGMRYTWRNPTLRGLGFSVTFGNLAHGMVTIVMPLIILERFGLGPAIVGLVFAASGISGMLSAFAFGRMDTRGREWGLLVWPMVALVPTIGILLVALGQASVWVGLALVVVEMLLVGVLIGPMDIALFTVRQRRTDPAWMGRAFAVSMAFNYLGVPIGAALGGLLADGSIELAILVLGIGGATASALAAAFLVPREDTASVAIPAGNGRQPAA